MTSPIANEIIGALKDILGTPSDKGVALHEPLFKGREWELVKNCLDTGWVSSAGSYVGEFEKAIASACGASHAVAVVNGTSALHIALLMSGVCPEDEVIVPSLTFVATVNAVRYCYAVPHFADVDIQTLGLDPHKLRHQLKRIGVVRKGQLHNRKTGRPIRAIVPMHTFGHPVEMTLLMALAEEFGLAVIEDSTESLGSIYKGQKTGGIARLGTLSFNGNKAVTTGGGGAVVMNDEALFHRIKHITSTAKVPHKWEFIHDAVGYNYRLPNINAALGVAQMETFPEMLAAKRRLAEAYDERFACVRDLSFYRERTDTKANYWLNALLLNKGDNNTRDEILQATNAAGYMTRPIWTAMHQLPMYISAPKDDLTITEELVRRVINIPSSAKHGLALMNGNVA
jgi:perosamine synthetase